MFFVKKEYNTPDIDSISLSSFETNKLNQELSYQINEKKSVLVTFYRNLCYRILHKKFGYTYSMIKPMLVIEGSCSLQQDSYDASNYGLAKSLPGWTSSYV
jgi:hypothetical protein